MQPYEKRDDYLDSGTGLTTDSEADTESTTTEEEESSSDEDVNQDRRMQADQDWRTAQQSWLAAPGRTTTGVMPNTILPLRTPPPTSVIDLPTELRASDIKRHIVNIDSQFRETPEMTTASDFYFRILTTVRNVLRVRVTSIEFPNNYPFFTKVRRSIQFVLDVSGGGPAAAGSYLITIPEGNYGAGEMEDALNAEFAAYSITVTWNETRGRFTFQNASESSPFGFSINTSQPTTGTYARPIAYGLGYYLGFTRGVHIAKQAATGGPYMLVSNVCANFAGDRYVFLKVNDFDCVTQTTEENDFTALAKVVLREPKNYTAFDDYASQHIKEVVFHNPRDLTRFHVRVLDPWGNPVGLCSGEFSFSMELLEVKNQSLFNAMRDSIATKYV